MVDDPQLTERVARPGDIIETEAVYELTDTGLAYVAQQEARSDG